MKKFILLSVSFLILWLPLSSSSGDMAGPHAPQVQGISILGKRSGDVMKEMKVTPFTKISVDRGTRVYWTNKSDTPIQLKFGKGEQCVDISKAPQKTQDWRYDKCHITKEPIPPKKTLEIYFDEQGVYDYEIQFVETKSVFKAQIVVY